MSESPLSWGQISTILFFGGFVWWVIRFTGRNLRSQIGDDRPSSKRNELTPLEVDAILAHRLVTPERLFLMSAGEQRILAETAQAMGSAPSINTPAFEAAPPVAHCPSCGTLIENWPAQVPWRCECVTCGTTLVLRRDSHRYVLSYTPRD